MKKWLSLSLALCMLLSLFCSTAVFAAADTQYETVTLNGFTDWTQAELDSSSGNNGYANGCSAALTVVTDDAYIVGGGKQAIKAVYGGNTAYNNCIVNWKYGSGGPCTAGNVWASADGSSVDYAAYDGIRVAVLNANGQPADFSRITFRVTEGWNYSNNMRYWDSTVVRDDEGYFYFDFASFKAAGNPAGQDIYDYMKSYAKGISMLCYGGDAEGTCYYSAVELYRVKGTVQKNALKDAVRQLEGYGVAAYADEIAVAKAVINNDNATQEEVDAQLAIIEACIEQYKTAAATGYTYVAMDGIQNWTEEEAASMNGFGSVYSVSDQCLVGDAKQSIKLTANANNTRFCFATQKKTGAFSTMNPFKITNEADGKLSDYDGIAIAFTDENGEPLDITKFTARLMRDSNDWGSYWNFEANYTDFATCYINGYYHLNFADFPALAGAIDDVSILSILFYKDIKTGDVAYLSDIKAYSYEEPEIIEYEYAQLDGIQNWTEDEAASMNGFSSVYSISDQCLVGAAKQSLKLTATSANTRFCFATQQKTGAFSTMNPFKVTNAADGKLSDYDGIAIAFTDENGEPLEITKFTARLMRDKADWGSYWNYEVNYTDMAACYYDGYYHLNFADYKALNAEGIDNLAIMSILFYRDIKVGDTAYLSDIKAYRVKTYQDYSELEKAIETLKANNADGKYDADIAAAEAVLGDRKAEQETIDAMVGELNAILRPILLPEVNFDEDNIVVSFGAISDIHITESATSAASKKYENALQLLKKYAGGKLDAITIAGDISSNTYNSDIGTAFRTITDAQMGKDANVFFVTGNHDAQSGTESALARFYTDMAKYTVDDLASSQHDRGNRHKVINGYHYIAVNMLDYWAANEATFAKQDLEWLATELAAARADAPGQPIFVYVHAGVYGTTYGSDLYTGTHWGSKAIYSYLENYPEVVTFSGHVHFPLMDERTIYQKDFTSLNCGSVQYMAIENGYLQSGSATTVNESHQVSGGLLVQVDKNNNLKITRLDFANDAVIKEPFYISAPDYENKANLLHYNDDYFHLDNTAPVFSKSAQVSGKIVGNYMQVTFDAATDNDMVHHYVIEIKDLPGGAVKSAKAFSEFYLYSQVKDFPDSYTFNVPYAAGTGTTGYEISVYAVDSMGLQSDPIVYKSEGGEIPEPPVSDNLFENGDFEIGTADGWATYQGSAVSKEAAYNGIYGFKAIGTGNWNSMFSQTVSVEPGKNYILSFWVKAVSNGVNVQVREDNWQGTPVSGAGGWYSTNGYSDWTYVEYAVVSNSDVLFFNVNGAGNNIAECVYFDDIKLVDVSTPGPDPDPEPTGPIANGGFETGDLTDWTNLYGSCTVDFVEGYNSNYALQMSCNQWNQVRQDGIDVVPNTDYTLSAWVKNTSHFTLLAKKGDDSGNIAEKAADGIGDEWTKIEFTFNSGDETTICVLLMGNEDGATAIIDNVELIKGDTHLPEPIVYGDLNADDKINNKDLGLLQQYLSDYEVTIVLDAADVNADGKVNNKDLGLLQQYLSDWDVTLGPVEPVDPRPELKILSIGHSFSKDAMRTYMYDLFEAAGYKVTIGYLYYPGCALERHYHYIKDNVKKYEEYSKNSNGTWKTVYNTNVTKALWDEDWDIVTIQPSPDYGQGVSYKCDWGCNKTIANDYVHFNETVDLVKGYLASEDNPHGPNTDVEFYYHLTWAFSEDCELWSYTYSGFDQMRMYNDFIKATKDYVVPNSDILGVIPCITSVQNARSSFMGDTFNEPVVPGTQADGYHLNDKGDLVAAMTWVAYFTGKDAMSFKIDTKYSDAEYAAIAEAVDNAIETPWSVTESGYKTEP